MVMFSGHMTIFMVAIVLGPPEFSQHGIKPGITYQTLITSIVQKKCLVCEIRSDLQLVNQLTTSVYGLVCPVILYHGLVL